MTTLISKVGTLDGMLDAALFDGVKEITDVDIASVREGLNDTLKDDQKDIGELSSYEKSLFVYRKMLNSRVKEVLEQFPEVQAELLFSAFFGGDEKEIMARIPLEEMERITEARTTKRHIGAVLDALLMARLGDKIAQNEANAYVVYGDFRVASANRCPNCHRIH